MRHTDTRDRGRVTIIGIEEVAQFSKSSSTGRRELTGGILTVAGDVIYSSQKSAAAARKRWFCGQNEGRGAAHFIGRIFTERLHRLAADSMNV